MDRIKIHDKFFKPFIPNAKIESVIDDVAEKINADYASTGEIPVLLCVLTGSIMFTAGLMKRLNFPLEVMSLKLSSYTGTQSSGQVLEVMGLTAK